MIELRRVEGDIPDLEMAWMSQLFEACFGERPDADFAERVREKLRPMALIALEADTPIGYKLGYEERRKVFYSWLGGVHPDHRRSGVARELMREQHAWAHAQGYEAVTTGSTNRFRSMIVLNLLEGFEITGTTQDPDGTLKVWMRKPLSPG